MPLRAPPGCQACGREPQASQRCLPGAPLLAAPQSTAVASIKGEDPVAWGSRRLLESRAAAEPLCWRHAAAATGWCESRPAAAAAAAGLERGYTDGALPRTGSQRREHSCAGACWFTGSTAASHLSCMPVGWIEMLRQLILAGATSRHGAAGSRGSRWSRGGEGGVKRGVVVGASCDDAHSCGSALLSPKGWPVSSACTSL